MFKGIENDLYRPIRDLADNVQLSLITVICYTKLHMTRSSRMIEFCS